MNLFQYSSSIFYTSHGNVYILQKCILVTRPVTDHVTGHLTGHVTGTTTSPLHLTTT